MMKIVIISESDREERQRFAELKEKIFPAKKEAMAEGASNADFHYLGSGRIYSNIGEAFAKAWLELTDWETGCVNCARPAQWGVVRPSGRADLSRKQSLRTE